MLPDQFDFQPRSPLFLPPLSSAPIEPQPMGDSGSLQSLSGVNSNRSVGASVYTGLSQFSPPYFDPCFAGYHGNASIANPSSLLIDPMSQLCSEDQWQMLMSVMWVNSNGNSGPFLPPFLPHILPGYIPSTELPAVQSANQQVPLYSVPRSAFVEATTSLPLQEPNSGSGSDPATDYQELLLRINDICSRTIQPEDQINQYHDVSKKIEQLESRCEKLLESASEEEKKDLQSLSKQIKSTQREIDLFLGLAHYENSSHKVVNQIANDTFLHEAEKYLSNYLGDLEELQRHPDYIAPEDLTKKFYALSILCRLYEQHLVILQSQQEECLREIVRKQTPAKTKFDEINYLKSLKIKCKIADKAFQAVSRYALSIFNASEEFSIDYEFTLAQLKTSQLLAIGAHKPAAENRDTCTEYLEGIELCNGVIAKLAPHQMQPQAEEKQVLFPYRMIIAGKYIDIHFLDRIVLFRLSALADSLIAIKQHCVLSSKKGQHSTLSITKKSGEQILRSVAAFESAIQDSYNQIDHYLSQPYLEHPKQLCVHINELVIEIEYLSQAIHFLNKLELDKRLGKGSGSLMQSQYRLLELQQSLLKVLQIYGIKYVYCSLHLTDEVHCNEVFVNTKSLYQTDLRSLLSENIKQQVEVKKQLKKLELELPPSLKDREKPPTTRSSNIAFRRLLRELDAKDKQAQLALQAAVERKQQEAHDYLDKAQAQDNSSSLDQVVDSYAMVVKKGTNVSSSQIDAAYAQYYNHQYESALLQFETRLKDPTISIVDRANAQIGRFHCYFAEGTAALKNKNLVLAVSLFTTAEQQLTEIQHTEAYDCDELKAIEFSTTIAQFQEDLQELKEKTVRTIYTQAERTLSDFRFRLEARDHARSLTSEPSSNALLSETTQAIRYREMRRELADKVKVVSGDLTRIPLLKLSQNRSDNESNAPSQNAKHHIAQRMNQLHTDGFSTTSKKSYYQQLLITEEMLQLAYQL